MSDLDLAKEEIAYLKLWLGITVVTISLVAGLRRATSRRRTCFWRVAYGIYLPHRRIERKIASLREM